MDKVYDFLMGFNWVGPWAKMAVSFALVAVLTFLAVSAARRNKVYSPSIFVAIYFVGLTVSVLREVYANEIHYMGLPRLTVTGLELLEIVGWLAAFYFFTQERWTLRVERRPKDAGESGDSNLDELTV